MTDETVEKTEAVEEAIEKVEEPEVGEGNLVKFSEGEKVFIGTFAIDSGIAEITEWEVKQFDQGNFSVLLEGMVKHPSGDEVKVHQRVDLIKSFVYRDYESAKQRLEQDMIRLILKTQKALKGLG
jgi:hypothetical protein